MKFKNDDNSRYFVRFMPTTERVIKQLTVKEFISYLEENAVLEDETREYIDGKGVTCQLYNLKEENSNLHKEFLVTEDDRVFYYRTLNDKIEFEDKKEEIKMKINGKIVSVKINIEKNIIIFSNDMCEEYEYNMNNLNRLPKRVEKDLDKLHFVKQIGSCMFFE